MMGKWYHLLINVSLCANHSHQMFLSSWWKWFTRSILTLTKLWMIILIRSGFTSDFFRPVSKARREVANYIIKKTYPHLYQRLVCLSFMCSQTFANFNNTWSRLVNGSLRSSVLDHVYCNNATIVDRIIGIRTLVGDHICIKWLKSILS